MISEKLKETLRNKHLRVFLSKTYGYSKKKLICKISAFHIYDINKT